MRWPDWSIENFKSNEYLCPTNIDDNVQRCKRFKLKINDEEFKNKLINWLDDCRLMYNTTTEYLQPRVIADARWHKFKLVKDKVFRNRVNFYNVREVLKHKKNLIKVFHKCNTHTLDYAIKTCCEMYKSAFSNYKAKNCSHFRIRPQSKNKIKKTMTIEQGAFSKNGNGFFGIKDENIIEIENNDDIKLNRNYIKHDCKLQYNSITKEFGLFIPVDRPKKTILGRINSPIGIDPGLKTFATCYSEKDDIQIKVGNNSEKVMEKYYKKIDNLNERRERKEINIKTYQNANYKYQNKLRNSFIDLHWKLSSWLVKFFDTIKIGMIKTRNIVSKKTPVGPEVLGRALTAKRRHAKKNKKSTISPEKRRKMNTLNMWKFIQRLKIKAEERGAKIIEIDEAYTTQECSECGTRNQVGLSREYSCASCGFNRLDRDLNAARNISKRKR